MAGDAEKNEREIRAEAKKMEKYEKREKEKS